VVYDPQKSARGQVAVKAIRLKDAFITLFTEGKLTGGAWQCTPEAACTTAGRLSLQPNAKHHP